MPLAANEIGGILFMYSTTIYRKCPFCKDGSFKIELWNKYQDIWLLKCTNAFTSASMWVTRNEGGRFQQIAVHYPKKDKRQMMPSYQKQEFDKLQIPFWKMMGLKPKPQEIAYEKMLKRRNMTYGDAVLERDRLNNASTPSSMPKVMEHLSA